MAIHKLSVYLCCALLISCKLQKAKLRGSDGASSSIVPAPKVLMGTFVVKLIGKGSTSSGSSSSQQKPTPSKISSVAAGPALYPLHYSFLIAFSADGREARFSTCLDSDAEASKTEGTSITSDDKMPLIETLRFGGAKRPKDLLQSPESDSSGSSTSVVFSREKIKCAKEMASGSALFLASSPKIQGEKIPTSSKGPSAEEAVNDKPGEAIGSSANETVRAEVQVPGNALKYVSDANLELQLRANSEGWQMDKLSYFGREALVEQVVEK
jgi:hypothetical protein